MKRSTADAINVLGQFCGMRDVERLDSAALLAKYSIPQADVFVLFGGSILEGGDLLAQAIKDRIAKVYVIVTSSQNPPTAATTSHTCWKC